jgi:hypothetical protein
VDLSCTEISQCAQEFPRECLVAHPPSSRLTKRRDLWHFDLVLLVLMPLDSFAGVDAFGLLFASF